MGNSGSNHVRRRDADAVFIATSTEPLRKNRSSDLQHPLIKEKKRKQAEDIVVKGKARVDREAKKAKKKG